MTEDAVWKSFTAELTREERAVRSTAFQAIVAGEVVDTTALARATALAPEHVDAVLGRLISRGLAVIEPGTGRVVGIGGLSLVPTQHRLRMRGREFFTWCAWDAIGIPSALAEDATVSSSCGECGQALNVELSAGQVTRAEPSTTLLWMRPLEPGRSVVGFT